MYLQRGRARSSSPLPSSLFPHVRGRLLRVREIRVCLRPHLGLTRHSFSRLGDSVDEGGPMSTRRIAYAAVLAALYVVIGQFVRIPNPMVGGGAIIAINMVVVVIAGILLGPAGGALTGLVGTSLNAVFLGTGAAPYEFAAIIPHTIMGFTAGVVGRRDQLGAAVPLLVGAILE